MKKSLKIGIIALLCVMAFSGCLTTYNASQNANPNPFQSGEVSTEGQYFMLYVSADIPDVHIYVNGNFMGNGSIESHFKSGTYRVEIRAAGYETYEEVVILHQAWTIVAKMRPLEVVEEEFEVKVDSDVEEVIITP